MCQIFWTTLYCNVSLLSSMRALQAQIVMSGRSRCRCCCQTTLPTPTTLRPPTTLPLLPPPTGLRPLCRRRIRRGSPGRLRPTLPGRAPGRRRRCDADRPPTPPPPPTTHLPQSALNRRPVTRTKLLLCAVKISTRGE